MMMSEENELAWDRLLKIRTSGWDDFRSDQNHHPYEPTPYCVLERLAGSGFITKKNHVVDYGCGKGRVDFYLSYQLRCETIGIEYDRRIFRAAQANRKRAVSGSRTLFLCQSAESYEPPLPADRFYFFNPFSLELFLSVLEKLRDLYRRTGGEKLLFFYYPSDEYRAFLARTPILAFRDEILCQDLFPGKDSRERILIYQLQG